ncbi:PGF-pre-PGF domain-containing protein [Haloferax sulfurifontis]|uniref:PGF-pre-PGF domain-containing protein n=1 Tax=Haloferax sulfurifontis TaxID=255616 RepID=UPI0006780BCF|nr:PGF-pre-PGF domain-containing protein [Haloferax sulfurifontis]
MVFSVIAGPVSASVGTTTGEAQLGGPPANQLDTVDDDQLTQASENISVWDGAFLTLRPDDTDPRLDSAAAYQVQSVNTYVRVGGPEQSLRKNPMYVYNVGQEVPFTFAGSNAGAPRAIEDQDVQLVAAKLEKGASIPRSISGVAETLTSDDSVTSSVVGSAQGAADDNSFAFTPDESGMWMFAVVTVDDGNGFSDANGDGNLETDGNVTFVGVDALPVQQGSSSVSAPSPAGNGQNVTVTVDASSLDATEVSHTVAIFNESDLSNYDQTINATDRSSISLETEIARVNGTSQMPADANVMGVTPGSQSFVGSQTAMSIFDRFNDSTSQFDDVRVVSPGATVYGSAVTKVAGNRTTVEVPIPDGATPGDYVVMHVATNQSGTESVTNRAPLQVAESVQLNLTANTTTPVAGDDVEFTVTREDTGAAVQNAEVTVGDTTVQTDANGVAVVTVPTAGEYDAIASKNVTNGEAFADATLALDVFEPATFEYSNLTVEPQQVVPGTDVVANATVENVGEVNGSYEAALTIDGEAQSPSDTGALQPGESTEVSFTTSFDDPGTYNVSIDELSTDDDELVSRTVRVIAPANTSVTDVTVEPTSINTTERYTVSATVENIGGLSDLVRLTYTTTGDESGTEVYNVTRTVAVSPDSTVTRNVTALAPTALGSDDVGNFTVAVNDVEADSTLTVTRRDRLPPTVRLPAPAQGAVPFGTPITLSVSDESDIRRATYNFGNGPQPLSLDANGSATVPTGDLDEGQTTLTVNATDTAGNTITRTFTFDFVSSPRVTSVAPTDVAGPSSTVSASFADDRNGDSESGINASATRLVVDGTAVDLSGATTNTNSTLEINVSELGVPLAEGPTTARLTVVDEAGHATSRLFEFEYDETAPTASLTLDPDYDEDREDVSANNPVDITLDSADDNLESAAFVVRNNDGDEVYTRDVTSLARSTGAFEIEWDGTNDDGALVASCSYNLTLVGTDAGGNTGVANATVCVDNDEPTYDVSAVDGTTDTVYTNGSVDVTYSTSESVTVEYTFESDSGVTATFERTPDRTPDGETGNHTLDVASELPDGSYTLTATATDLGNNDVTVERSEPVVVDTTDPGVTATLNTTESGNLSVSVASTEPLADTPDAELTYPNDDVESLALTRLDSTTWTAELATNESGEYALDVTGTDRAGNTASDSSTATVTSNNFSEQSTLLLVSSSGNTFIRINASDDADLPAGQTVVTLTDTNIPPNALSQGTAATRYLEANAGLTEDQIEDVTYGFSADLDTSGNGFNIVYIERGGTRVLPTTLQTDPFGLSGDYYTATRTGLSTYGAVTNDTEAPTISYDDPTEGVEFSEVNNTVSVNATLSDNVDVNTSSVSVTVESDGQLRDVTDNATVTNESVNYTTPGLPPADYTVTIEASDTNLTANTATEQVNFTVQDDREAPTVTALGPTDGTTFPFGTDTVELNATYEEASDAVNDTGVDAENVTVLYDGQDISASAAPDATGFNTTVPVDDDETHNLTVRVPDNAGNSVESTTNFSIAADDTDPAVEISNPAEGDELSNTTTSVNVTASVDDAESGVNLSSVTVTFDGTDVTSEANLDDLSNVWFNKTGLEPGTNHTVSVSAADRSGNENASTVNFSVAPDLTAPNVTRVSSRNATFGSDANFSVEVNYTDPESGIDASAVTILLDGEDVTDDATVFPNPGATLDLNSSEIDSGDHQLSVRVTNNNGDTTTNDTTFSVNQGPDIAVTSVSLDPATAQTGDKVEVTAEVENFGDESGSTDVGVTGTSQAGTTDFGVTKSVTLATGENQSVNFVIKPTNAGTYTVAVNGTTATNALDVSSPTADIQLLGDSSASPTSLLEGEETTVTVKLGNLGGASGNVSGDVTRNGTTVGNVSTSLASGAQRTFTFTDTPPGTGDYVYAFNGTTIDTVTVSARAPAFSIDAGASTISQTTVDTDETFTVKVRVNNTGTAEGTYTKALTAGRTTLATESVTVGPGSSGTLTYSVSIDDAGTYDLRVDGVTIGSITVEEANVGGGGGGGGGNSLPHDDTTDSDRLFSAPGFDAQFDGGQGVSAVSITFSQRTTGEITVSERSGLPGSVGQPGGTAVSYVRIDVPDSARDRQSTLRFTVRQSRLDELGVESSDLVVRRFNEDAGSWEDLETRVVDSGDGAVVIEADTPGFSYFAVTSRQVVTTTTDDDTTTTTTPDDGTTTASSTPGFDDETSTTASGTTDSPVPGFGAALAVVALLAAALLAVRRND